jgi:carboxyl-terminal processing protease
MKPSSLIRIVLAVALATCFAGEISAQKKRPVPPPPSVVNIFSTPTSSQTVEGQRRQAAFETAWQTLNQQYYDKTFGGLDWNKVHDEFEPKVAAAKTDHEFHGLLASMIRRLGKSHLTVIEPEYFEELKRAKTRARIYEKRKASGLPVTDDDVAETAETVTDEAEGGRYGIGVELRMLGNQFVVSHVDELSGAKLAGLKPGYALDKINGVSMQDLVDKARIAGYSDSDIHSLLPIEIAEYFLNGGPETNVYLTCLDEDDKPTELKVPRLRLLGQTFILNENLPEQFLRYESRSLSPEVGYIKFNAFAEPVVGKFCDSIGAFKDKQAVILDLRGNIGGVIGVTVGLAGMLTDSEITIGDFVSRKSTEHFIAKGRAKRFTGKLIVLMDESSVSAAEMFAAGLKGSSRVVTIGTRTGGKCLPAVWTKLQTGAVLMYPIADFLTTQVGSLEGRGLEPDLSVPLDRKSLILGHDLQLEKAISVAGDDALYLAKVKAVLPRATAEREDDLAAPAPRAAPKASSTGGLSTAPGPVPDQNQAGPLKVVEHFRELIGGDDLINKLQSYEIRGEFSSGVGKEKVEFHSVRQNPDKFMLEYRSGALGDIREIYKGKSMFIQTGIGYDTSSPNFVDSSYYATLTPFLQAMDLGYLRGLKDQGSYDVDGQKRRVLSGRSPQGFDIGMSFDEKTGLLATYALPGVVFTMSDYRKVDGMLMPFRLDTDRGTSMTFKTVKLNAPIQPGDFERKPQCYDIPN